MVVDCSDSCVLLLMRVIIEQITAGSLMVGTPIILVQRPISLGLIKDLCNHAITVRRPLKWRKSRKERWSYQESNPGPLAYCAKCSATELQLPPATIPRSCPYVACSNLWLIVQSTILYTTEHTSYPDWHHTYWLL